MSEDKKPEEIKPEVPVQPDDPELKQLLNDLADENAAGEVVEPEVEVEPIPDPNTLVESTPTTEVMAKDMSEQQITEFVKKFGEVSNEILGNYKSDRDQINDTIEYLENIVFNSGGQRVHVEMLVAALRTKAETNSSAVKLLDSLAKFLAATKGTGVFVQNNNNTVIQEDLAKILSKDLYPDEVKNAKNK